MRKACFDAIPCWTGSERNPLKVKALGPLALLPTSSDFSGEGTLFDMAEDSIVYVARTSNGRIELVLIAVNADFDVKALPYRKNPFNQVFVACRNQFVTWDREKTVRLSTSPQIPVIFFLREHVIFSQYTFASKMFDGDPHHFSWFDKTKLDE